MKITDMIQMLETIDETTIKTATAEELDKLQYVCERIAYDINQKDKFKATLTDEDFENRNVIRLDYDDIPRYSDTNYCELSDRAIKSKSGTVMKRYFVKKGDTENIYHCYNF